MSDPRRLLDLEPQGLERELLEVGRDDRISERSRQRIWAGVAGGVGAALPAAGTASAAGATGGAAAGAGGAAAGGSAAGGGAAVGGAAGAAAKLGLSAWVGIGLLSGGILVGGTAHFLSETAPPAVAMKVPRTSQSKAASVRLVAPVEASPATEPSVAENAAEPVAPAPATAAAAPPRAPSAALALRPRVAGGVSQSKEPPAVAAAPSAVPTPAAAPATAAPATAAPAASVTPDALEGELKVLDRARQALRGGDAKRAARELEEHNRRFSLGVLAPEAYVLRIELAFKRGDRAGASLLARDFLAKYPTSPHAARVRAVLAAASQ